MNLSIQAGGDTGLRSQHGVHGADDRVERVFPFLRDGCVHTCDQSEPTLRNGETEPLVYGASLPRHQRGS